MFDATPDAYRNGTASFDFHSAIYGAADVKQTLRAVQHDKCCFCESKVSHVCPGDIEHFRPKGAVTEVEAGPLCRPGYYWLAYEWTNLLYCCEICNRRGKRSYFPLRYNGRRARTRTDRIDGEDPLFINPADDDPSKHLAFREEVVRARSRRGEVTLQALQLNRNELLGRRWDHLNTLKTWITCHAELLRGIREARRSGYTPHPNAVRQVEQIEQLFRSWMLESGEYAAMVRAFIRSRRFRFTTLG